MLRDSVTLIRAEETLPGWVETIIMLFVPGSHRLQRSALRNRGAASQCQSGVTLTNPLSTPTLKVFTKLSKTASLRNNHLRTFSLPPSGADSGEQVTLISHNICLAYSEPGAGVGGLMVAGGRGGLGVWRGLVGRQRAQGPGHQGVHPDSLGPPGAPGPALTGAGAVKHHH